jgi:hypothetical protein
LVPNPTTEFAPSSSRSGTSAGIAERLAVRNSCPASARSATSRSNNGSDGSQTAITTTSAACTTSQLTITLRRSNRSLTAPVSGPNSDGAKSPTSSSRATATPRPVLSATNSIKATRLIESPA